MRICLVYDCLFPWTVGGAERWMRNVAEALAADGHDVTYLTRRQWDDAGAPDIAGVRVIAVSGRDELYGPDGTRRIAPPLRFGAGVLRHLWRHGGDFDVVHTASFPYFSLLAAGLARRRHGFRVVADWHEVWSAEYWSEYLGPLGPVGAAVQTLCAQVPQRAFCFSQLHAGRLAALGLRGPEPVVLRGEWAGSTQRPDPAPAAVPPHLVFAGRLIPEKQAPAIVGAVVEAAREVPGLHATIFGDGPQRDAVRAEIDRLGAHEVVAAPGFVDAEVLHEALREALCLLLPSRREGYGMVVVEAASLGVPTITVAEPDNAAVEFITDDVNGFVAADASPEELARRIVLVADRGPVLRERTADWFADHADELSLRRSLERVLTAYSSARS
ncbi:MAG TPA: glycosyltransferase family 4 protein [Baekduia sp.]|nr:glycosyltransferase family 4 protein [Baekduia sp.]